MKFENGGMPAASSSITGTPAGLVIARILCRRSFAQGGVDHGGLRSQGAREIVHSFGDDQLGPGEAESAVKGAAAAHDDDFAFHAGGIGKLVDPFGVCAGDAARGGRGHGAGRAGGDHAVFGAGELARGARRRLPAAHTSRRSSGRPLRWPCGPGGSSSEAVR